MLVCRFDTLHLRWNVGGGGMYSLLFKQTIKSWFDVGINLSHVLMLVYKINYTYALYILYMIIIVALESFK